MPGPEKYTDEDLLGQCDVETFTSSGPGGQNVNRRETAVRLRHRPSGIVVTCQRERSQHRNKQIAISMIREKLSERRRRRAPRIKTRMPRGIKEAILKTKRVRSERKRTRKKPRPTDD